MSTIEQKVSHNIVDDRISKAKETDMTTKNIIWKKMISWGIVLLKENKSKWYNLYQNCAISIFKMDKIFLQDILYFKTNT